MNPFLAPSAVAGPSTRCVSAGGDALRTFRDAFVTELGPELGRLVSLRELLDVIICAGKDCLIQASATVFHNPMIPHPCNIDLVGSIFAP